MGQQLGSPATSKDTQTWTNENYIVAASCMQGWRMHMEDAHTCLLELPGDPKAAYFSVFDGHGGTRVAKHASLHLHQRILAQPEYDRNEIDEAIRQAFLVLDAEMQNEMTSYGPGGQKLPPGEKDVITCSSRSGLPSPAPPFRASHITSSPKSESSLHRSPTPTGNTSSANRTPSANLGDELAGSTGIVILLRDHVLYCANAGDSRAVCSRRGIADPLSTDHKPTLKGEKERILAAGGWVESNRVNGNLALSRAFGDFVFKRNCRHSAENQIVSANPDVFSRPLSMDEDEFLVLCCDGVWDVMTNQEVISFIRLRLSHGMNPSKVCEELMMRCLAPDCHTNGLGCDNMTIVLVCLLYGKPIADLQHRCSRPCMAGPAADILLT